MRELLLEKRQRIQERAIEVDKKFRLELNELKEKESQENEKLIKISTIQQEILEQVKCDLEKIDEQEEKAISDLKIKFMSMRQESDDDSDY